jgi:hypothetical protein
MYGPGGLRDHERDDRQQRYGEGDGSQLKSFLNIASRRQKGENHQEWDRFKGAANTDKGAGEERTPTGITARPHNHTDDGRQNGKGVELSMEC